MKRDEHRARWPCRTVSRGSCCGNGSVEGPGPCSEARADDSSSASPACCGKHEKAPNLSPERLSRALRDADQRAGTSRPSSAAVCCSQTEKSRLPSQQCKTAPQRPAAPPVPQRSIVIPPRLTELELLAPPAGIALDPAAEDGPRAEHGAVGGPVGLRGARHEPAGRGEREAVATGGLGPRGGSTRPGLTSAPRRGPSGEPSSRRTCRCPRGRAAGSGCPRCRSAPSADTATTAVAGRPSAQPARSSAWLRPAPGRRTPAFPLRSGREMAPPCPALPRALPRAARAPHSDRCRRDERGSCGARRWMPSGGDGSAAPPPAAPQQPRCRLGREVGFLPAPSAPGGAGAARSAGLPRGSSACRTSRRGAVSPLTCPVGGVGEPSGCSVAAAGPAEPGLARNARRHSCPLPSTCPRRAGFYWLDPLSASPPSPSREIPASCGGTTWSDLHFLKAD